MELSIKVVIHPAKGGGYWAEVPAMPGCYTQAETFEELSHNIRESIESWWEAANDRDVRPDDDDAGPLEAITR